MRDLFLERGRLACHSRQRSLPCLQRRSFLPQAAESSIRVLDRLLLRGGICLCCLQLCFRRGQLPAQIMLPCFQKEDGGVQIHHPGLEPSYLALESRALLLKASQIILLRLRLRTKLRYLAVECCCRSVQCLRLGEGCIAFGDRSLNFLLEPVEPT